MLNADDADGARGGGRLLARLGRVPRPRADADDSACDARLLSRMGRSDVGERQVQAGHLHAPVQRPQIFTDVKDVFTAAGDTSTPRFWIAGGKGFDTGKAPQDVGYRVRRRVAGCDRRRPIGREYQAAGGRQRRLLVVAVGIGNGDAIGLAPSSPPRARSRLSNTFASTRMTPT